MTRNLTAVICMGLVSTMGCTSTRQATTPTLPPASQVEYTVKQGDSLAAIAARRGTTVAAIKRENHLQSEVITVGQVLLVPPQRATLQSTAPTQTSASESVSIDNPRASVSIVGLAQNQPSKDTDLAPRSGLVTYGDNAQHVAADVTFPAGSEASKQLGECVVSLAPVKIIRGNGPAGSGSFIDFMGQSNVSFGSGADEEDVSRRIEDLLKAGADPNAVRIRGFVAPRAESDGFATSYKSGHSGQVVPASHEGLTLLEYCTENGLGRCAALLKEYGAEESPVPNSMKVDPEWRKQQAASLIAKLKQSATIRYHASVSPEAASSAAAHTVLDETTVLVEVGDAKLTVADADSVLAGVLRFFATNLKEAGLDQNQIDEFLDEFKGTRGDMRKDMVDEFVKDVIVRQEASRCAIQVSNSDIDAKIAVMKADLPPEFSFDEAVSMVGGIERLRERVKTDLLLEKLVDAELYETP